MKLDISKLRLLQLEAGLPTQGAFAEAAGITRQTLSTILNRGSCSLPTLAKLAAALHVDPAALIKED